VKRAVGNRSVIVGGLQAHAGVPVAEGDDAAEGDVVAVGVGARVQAVLAARQLHIFESHAIGIVQLDDVTAGGCVAAIEQGAARGMSLVVKTLDANARVAGADDQVGGQVVGAVVHTNDIAGTQIIGVQNSADRGLGCRRREAVVCVVA